MKARLHSQYLSTNGDGTGTSAFIGDYTVPIVAYAAAPAGQTFRVTRILISVGDTSTMTAEEYGNLGNALSPGIEIKVTTKAGTEEISDLTGGKPITTNAEWGRQCYDADIKSWGTTPTNQLLVARYTFERHGQAIHLNADDRLQITFADDFTGLLSHDYLVQGVLSP